MVFFSVLVLVFLFTLKEEFSFNNNYLVTCIISRQGILPICLCRYIKGNPSQNKVRYSIPGKKLQGQQGKINKFPTAWDYVLRKVGMCFGRVQPPVSSPRDLGLLLPAQEGCFDNLLRVHL